jgi:hypothetical protein
MVPMMKLQLASKRWRARSFDIKQTPRFLQIMTLTTIVHWSRMAFIHLWIDKAATIYRTSFVKVCEEFSAQICSAVVALDWQVLAGAVHRHRQATPRRQKAHEPSFTNDSRAQGRGRLLLLPCVPLLALVTRNCADLRRELRDVAIRPKLLPAVLFRGSKHLGNAFLFLCSNAASKKKINRPIAKSLLGYHHTRSLFRPDSTALLRWKPHISPSLCFGAFALVCLTAAQVTSPVLPRGNMLKSGDDISSVRRSNSHALA